MPWRPESGNAFHYFIRKGGIPGRVLFALRSLRLCSGSWCIPHIHTVFPAAYGISYGISYGIPYGMPRPECHVRYFPYGIPVKYGIPYGISYGIPHTVLITVLDDHTLFRTVLNTVLIFIRYFVLY